MSAVLCTVNSSRLVGIMSLEFRVCGVCDERHAVQHNGQMSIHRTAVGERCTGIRPVDLLRAKVALAARRAVDERRRNDLREQTRSALAEEDRVAQLKANAVKSRQGTNQAASKRERHLRHHPGDATPEEIRHRYTMIRTRIQAAEQKARDQRRNPLFGLNPAPDPLDRKIYVVDGARPVRGGLPTLGKGR